jgi:hypothetical protein
MEIIDDETNNATDVRKDCRNRRCCIRDLNPTQSVLRTACPSGDSNAGNINS